MANNRVKLAQNANNCVINVVCVCVYCTANGTGFDWVALMQITIYDFERLNHMKVMTFSQVFSHKFSPKQLHMGLCIEWCRCNRKTIEVQQQNERKNAGSGITILPFGCFKVVKSKLSHIERQSSHTKQSNITNAAHFDLGDKLSNAFIYDDSRIN